MSKEELNAKLSELEKSYKDVEIPTPEGIVHVYYAFKAGQKLWEKHFDRFNSTEKNFKEAKEYILDSFGYLGRDSSLVAIKKCYIESENEETVFEYQALV